ncbi:universal stress protein [Pseudonocardia sp.]
MIEARAWLSDALAQTGALAGAFVGSVAVHAVHHARCPVVLVPAPPDGA